MLALYFQDNFMSIMLDIVHFLGDGCLQASGYRTDKVLCYFFTVKLITSAWIGSDRFLTPRLKSMRTIRFWNVQGRIFCAKLTGKMSINFNFSAPEFYI
jgi:hypothetical protein